ncbi:MAG: L,D-transpeptidase [Gemmatimonadota bacterium]|nr:L,D-transpeptidase [Gemmatimonadota bacterium]
MTLILLATVGAGLPAATTGAPAAVASATNGVRLRVSLGQRRLVIEDGGQVVREFGVAIGSPSFPTPKGQFTIRKMIWNPAWVPPKNRAWARGKQPRNPGDPANPMQTVKIFFREPYYYIHGTNDPKSIGEAASHGCLRMTPEDAAELGAYLMEQGGQPRGENWFRRVLRFGRSTVIYLDNPIPLTIGA